MNGAHAMLPRRAQSGLDHEVDDDRTRVALLAAVPPLVTVPVERWFRKRGLLAGR